MEMSGNGGNKTRDLVGGDRDDGNASLNLTAEEVGIGSRGNDLESPSSSSVILSQAESSSLSSPASGLSQEIMTSAPSTSRQEFQVSSQVYEFITSDEGAVFFWRYGPIHQLVFRYECIEGGYIIYAEGSPFDLSMFSFYLEAVNNDLEVPDGPMARIRRIMMRWSQGCPYAVFQSRILARTTQRSASQQTTTSEEQAENLDADEGKALESSTGSSVEEENVSSTHHSTEVRESQSTCELVHHQHEGQRQREVNRYCRFDYVSSVGLRRPTDIVGSSPQVSSSPPPGAQAFQSKVLRSCRFDLASSVGGPPTTHPDTFQEATGPGSPEDTADDSSTAPMNVTVVPRLNSTSETWFFSIPSTAAGTLLGDGGQLQRDFLNRFGLLRYNISKRQDGQTYRQVELCGEIGNLHAAFRAMQQLIEEKGKHLANESDLRSYRSELVPLGEGDVREVISIPASVAGVIIGQRGGHIGELERNSDSTIYILQRNPLIRSDDDTVDVHVQGPADGVRWAIRTIRRLVNRYT